MCTVALPLNVTVPPTGMSPVHSAPLPPIVNAPEEAVSSPCMHSLIQVMQGVD